MSALPSHLLPYQTDLVRQIVEPETVRIALVAPPGTGKTRAVISAIHELTSNDPSKAVLVVAPSAVGRYVSDALAMLDVPPRVRHLRGSDLRKYQESGLNLEGGVYVVSVVVARQPWVREVIESQPWALVFFDEATLGGAAVTVLIEELAASASTSRLCAASSTGWRDLPAGLQLVKWDIESVRRRPRRAELILFEREAAELEIRHRLTEIEDEFGADRGVRAALDSAWRSSSSAFEYVLARQATRLAGIETAFSSRPQLELFESAGEQLALSGGATSRSEVSTPAQWLDPEGASVALKDLLRRIGGVGSDSKLEAFRRHVLERSAESKILVFSAMRQTVAYLEAALEGDRPDVVVIDGSRTVTDPRLIAETQIVIVTDAVVGALDLEGDYQGCSYDLPWSPRVIDARYAHLGAASDEAVMFVVIDGAQTDSVEREILSRHKLIRDVLGDTRRQSLLP